MDILYLIIIFILYIIFIDFFKIIIIIIIIIGIILFIIYFKKIYISYPNFNYQRDDKINELPSESIYDYKVSKEYEKMFLQPSIDLGYQEYDKDVVHIPSKYQDLEKVNPSISSIDTFDNIYNSSIINNLFKRLFS